jgi:hypothetical protein
MIGSIIAKVKDKGLGSPEQKAIGTRSDLKGTVPEVGFPLVLTLHTLEPSMY